MAVDEGPIIEGPSIRIHPFGEQIKSLGQHPPPVAAEHWIVDGRHFGA